MNYHKEKPMLSKMKIQVKKGKLLFIFIALFCINSSFAQDTVIKPNKPTINFSGFMDVFYAFDFNMPEGDSRQAFLYNHNRHNEFNLNIGFIKLEVENTKYRGNLALQTGTYANDNYAAEPGTLKNIFEANAGISLNSKNNLWLDAGIFGSHIGFESAVSIDHWTITRSLLAENSPYFLSGAKLTYNPSEKLEIAALILNGWQRIQRVEGNSLPSFGTQLVYSPSENIIFNWSTFIGTDDPDYMRRMRYFNNFYTQLQITEKIGLIAGIDIGYQERKRFSNEYDLWFSPVMITRYSFNEKWATALRAEYYQDKTGIIIPTGTPNGFETSGISINLDYFPESNIAWRIEGRYLNSSDNIYRVNNTMANDNLMIVSSIAVKF
jgi:hypothetical protein